MIEILIILFSVVFLWSIAMIPFRIGEIRDLVECIYKKIEKTQKTRQSDDS